MLTRTPIGRMRFSRPAVLRVALGLVGVVVTGFISNTLSSTACERATRRWVEACYVRLAPAQAPPLKWVEPGQLDQYPNLTIHGEKPVYPSFRAWLFSPRVVFIQRERPPYQPGFRSSAYTVLRIPLPFITRVHYFWQFAVPFPAPDSRSSTGTMMLGTATYFCAFGHVVTLDQSQPPCTTPS